jgi:Trp operon repressor
MTNISKRPIDAKKLFKLYELFFEVVNNAGDKDEFMEIIKDILTPIEQIMIAKRIAIIYLLIKNVDQTTIVDYIKVSRSTVSRFKLLFYNKKTKLITIIESFLKNEKISHFFEDLFADIFTHVGYYPDQELKWQHEKRKEERKMIDV